MLSAYKVQTVIAISLIIATACASDQQIPEPTKSVAMDLDAKIGAREEIEALPLLGDEYVSIAELIEEHGLDSSLVRSCGSSSTLVQGNLILGPEQMPEEVEILLPWPEPETPSGIQVSREGHFSGEIPVSYSFFGDTTEFVPDHIVFRIRGCEDVIVPMGFNLILKNLSLTCQARNK